MDSSPTLHDFVLNLLTDATARSAFELDPEGALQDAGLGDITAADVQEVIPLVVDYAPVEGITAPIASDQLLTSVPEVDVAGAVRQLQAVTQQLTLGASYPSADVNATALGAVTFGNSGLLADPLGAVSGLDLGGLTTLPGAGADAAGGLSIDNDPAAGLDADLLSPVGNTATGVVAGTDQAIADTTVDGAFGTLDVAVNTVNGLTPNGLLDPLHLDDGAILPATSSAVGSVVGGVDSTVDSVVPVDSPLHGVGDTVSGVGGLVGGLTGADHAPASDSTGVTDLLF